MRKRTETKIPGKNFSADSMKVKMEYADQYFLVQGASGGVMSALGYSLNSGVSCNLISSSGQPQGWTNLAAQYGQYVITGSKINWRIAQKPTAQTYGTLGALGTAPTAGHVAFISACMYPKPSIASDATSVENMAVQPYASKRHDFCLEWNTNSEAEDGYTEVSDRALWTGSNSMTVSKLDGEPDLRSDSYEATTSVEPTRLCQWVFGFQDVTADAAYEAVFFVQVQVCYDVLFFGRKLVNDSLARVVNLKPLKTKIPMISVRAKKSEEEKKPPAADDDFELVRVKKSR